MGVSRPAVARALDLALAEERPRPVGRVDPLAARAQILIFTPRMINRARLDRFARSECGRHPLPSSLRCRSSVNQAALLARTCVRAERSSASLRAPHADDVQFVA